ncbi:MAG: MFS transporter [Desulfatirhabdiaceae bacterium]
MTVAEKNPSIFMKTAPIILGTAMVQLAVGVNAVLFPVTLQNLGYNKTLIGTCLSLDIVAVVIISRYLSAIIARVGIGRALILSTLIRGLCLYILSYSSNYAVWLICVFFFGMNTNIMLISLQTWINTIPLKSNKGLVIGIFSSALSLGTATGPVIANLTGTTGRLPFLVDLAIVVLTALPFILMYRWIPSIEAPPRPRILYAIRMAKTFMFSSFVGGITFYGLPAFLTLYGMMNNLSIERSAFLISMFMLGSITIGFLIASVSDRVNRLSVIVSCVFIGLMAAIYLPLAIYSYPQALVLLFIWGGVSGGIYATGLAKIGEIFRREDQVSANVAYSLMDCLGGVAGVLLIGVTMDLAGSDGLVYVILMAAIVYFIYTLSCYKID